MNTEDKALYLSFALLSVVFLAWAWILDRNDAPKERPRQRG